jgi:lactam utilization protein B
MSGRIDLNADLGESFGPWPMGADAALLSIVTSANVACGFHAGDPDVMAQAMALAVARGVGIGAHPGLPDLQGFGRRRMDIAPASAAHLVAYQLGAAQAMARAAGGKVRHLKLHGALANMAAADRALALACFRAALAVDPDVLLLDEVTAALDPELIGEVLAIIRGLKAEGMTMVIVTHEMGFARDVADRVCFLEGGRIVEQGPPAAMLRAPEDPRTRRFLERIIAAGRL